MFSASIFLLLSVGLTFAAPRQLVPYINTLDGGNGGFRLEPFEDRYELDVYQKSGSRIETVQEIAPGELLVKGSQIHDYDNKGQLTVTYEAGRSGYQAKYLYNIPPPPQHLPASVLKATVG